MPAVLNERFVDSTWLGLAHIARTLGGPGSGNYGHAGRPGEVGGSAVEDAEPYIGDFSSSSDDPIWSWSVNKDRTTVSPRVHNVIRPDNGMWGYSHGGSQAITGAAAEIMGITGYRSEPGDNMVIPNKFLAAIAADTQGSEETLYHSFENIKGVTFREGDTFRIPLTASSGDVGDSYGVRLDRDSQRGEPVVIVFQQGTQMAGYSTMTKRDAVDLGHQTVQEALDERQYLWDEALVAGGFQVLEVRDHVPLGLQHWRSKRDHGKAYGKVVFVKQTETFDPQTKQWVPRG